MVNRWKFTDYLNNKKTSEFHSQLEKMSEAFHKAQPSKNLPKVGFIADEITNHLITGKFYEETSLDRIFSYLETELLDATHGVAIDVGANIGNHTLYFQKKYQKVLSFEPHPETFSLLSINTRHCPEVKCFNFGLSDTRKQMKLYETAGNMGASSVMNSMNNSTGVDISLMRLDDVINELEIEKVHLIKIDVEGHEPEALLGAQELITRDKPIILMERSSWEGSFDISDRALNFLRGLGYIFHWEEPSPKRPILSQLIYLIRRWTIGVSTEVNWESGSTPPQARIAMLVAKL